MLDKIVIIDFEDSFTYNIASVLYPYENKLVIISHHDFFKNHLCKYLNSKDKHAIILGPGPGHPEEYRKYFLNISQIRKLKNFYVMGICLGHQILGLIDNKIIMKASEQIHGQTVLVDFKGEKRSVQRYNSLAVYDAESEVNVRTFDRGVSYQFHPESIGTDYNSLYFQELLEFVNTKLS